MFEITPVSMTQIDWTKFVPTANRITGRSPTRQLDKLGMSVQAPSAYLSALAEFRKEGSNPITCLRDQEAILHHYSIGFIVAIDRSVLLHVLENAQGLHTLVGDPSRHKENFIITGSLFAWRNAIFVGCNRNTPIESREFYNQIWEFFIRLGYQEMFSSRHKKDLDDNTFILEGPR